MNISDECVVLQINKFHPSNRPKLSELLYSFNKTVRVVFFKECTLETIRFNFELDFIYKRLKDGSEIDNLMPTFDLISKGNFQQIQVYLLF